MDERNEENEESKCERAVRFVCAAIDWLITGLCSGYCLLRQEYWTALAVFCACVLVIYLFSWCESDW